MSEIDLSQKFPGFEPTDKPPGLFTLNGIGLSLYGERDRDEESGAYVKTLSFTLIFVPLFFLRSYVVADAEKGWYFLGRVPISGFARAWNAVLLAGLITAAGAVGLESYRSNPEFKAEAMMAEAADFEAAGQRGSAVALWQRVINGRTSHARAAEAQLAMTLDGAIEGGRPGELADLMGTVGALKNKGSKERLREGLAEKGTRVLDASVDTRPGASMRLLDALVALDPENEVLEGRRRPLLETVVVAEPENVDAASQLAELLEAEEDFERIPALLEPHAQGLGTREGARILGQHYAGLGELDASRDLLLPYTEGRLAVFTQAEKAYDRQLDTSWSREIDNLNDGDATQEWYRRYDAAPEDEQGQMVSEWVNLRLREDRSLSAAEARMVATSDIVPVALDLGMIMVHRAHGLGEGERRAELEAAEKIFLGIQGAAGESDGYRLSLGQVYYWLGRPDEGEALFEQLLASHERSPEMLVNVGRTTRAVGAVGRAQELAEEAYAAAQQGAVKYEAAMLRALVAGDSEEQVVWYGRADPGAPGVRAALATSRGHVANSKGRRAEAIRNYKSALSTYGSMVDNSATLNNAALVHFNLFSVTGERQNFHDGVAKMEKALVLEPQDRIVLSNVASALTNAAVLDVVGDRIDLAALQTSADLGLFSYLYANEAERRAIYARYAQHPSAIKARGMWQKVLVLAPKDAGAYRSLMGLSYLQDDEGEVLTGLLGRLRETPVDTEVATKFAQEYWRGEDDEDLRARYVASIEQHRGRVEATRARGDLTGAVAATLLADTLLGANDAGLDVDLDEAVALAEKALSTERNSSSLSTLRTALLHRAASTLASSSPRWSGWLKATRRTLGSDDLIVWVLSRGGDAAREAAANADVMRAIEMVILDLDLYPSSASAWDWAVLVHTHPQLALSVVDRIPGDPARGLRYEANGHLQPTAAYYALQGSWRRQMEGADDALGPVRAFGKLGMALPPALVGDA